MATDLTLLLPLSPTEAVTPRAAQTELEAAAATHERPSREAEGVLGQQPGEVTPWQVLQSVQAELRAHGPVFDKPVEEVLADLRSCTARPAQQAPSRRFVVDFRLAAVRREPDEAMQRLAELPGDAAPVGRGPICQSSWEGLSDSEKKARQGRLLAFIDSCEPRMEELVNESMRADWDPADCIALLSDGTVLPRYTKLVPRSQVAEQVAVLRGQVREPFLDDEWDTPTPGTLLSTVLFERVQAVSGFSYSVFDGLSA